MLIEGTSLAEFQTVLVFRAMDNNDPTGTEDYIISYWSIRKQFGIKQFSNKVWNA